MTDAVLFFYEEKRKQAKNLFHDWYLHYESKANSLRFTRSLTNYAISGTKLSDSIINKGMAK